MITIVFYLLFGIFCVSLLKGTYDYCELIGIPNEKELNIVSMFDCINNGGLWTHPSANFDNAFNAMELMYTMG